MYIYIYIYIYYVFSYIYHMYILYIDYTYQGFPYWGIGVIPPIAKKLLILPAPGTISYPTKG